MPTLRYTLHDQEHRVALKDVTRIGRAEDNDLCVNDNSLSRYHAVIARDHDAFVLEDKGSSNGIHFGGRRVLTLALEDGMIFRLGDIELAFLGDDLAEPVVEEEQAAPPPSPVAPTPPPVPAALPTPAPTPIVSPPEAPVATATPATAPSAETPLPAPVETRLDHQDAAVMQLGATREKILAEIGKVIVGQKEVLNQILVALFARGHCLMIGVPGLAKTLMVKTLAQVVALDGNRIQFTPDLMPSDITGTDILEEDPITGKREFRFHKGPLFTNLLLADEINRTPPKTQAALLEAMQERRVTTAGTTYDLPDPFMVLATQNPIEQEGTYPLPEAQLDRFMFCVLLKYPSFADEQRVLLETTRDTVACLQKVIEGPSILRFQHLVRQVPVSEHVALYAMNIVRATRPETEGVPDFIKRWVRWGAGTRAGQYLLLAAKAHVLMQGRVSVSCADIREYAPPVLRHRMFCNFAAASEGVSTDDIIKKVLEAVKEPAYDGK